MFVRAMICLFLFCAGTGRAHADPGYPKLFFSYSWLYDQGCSQGSGYKIDPAWAEEARERASEFDVIWKREAPILFGRILERFGKGFSRKELTATLSVCNIPSFSDPLVLNVRRFLKSYMGNKPIPPDHAFSDLIFHELLHTWIVENLPWPTPLIEKYKSENGQVLSHLHLMALQKYVYTELGRADLLAWISETYPTMPGAYQRAWEIVDQIEGYQAFIAEIP
jgi:hypothetical protein